MPKNGYLRPKSVESDHHHWIVHIRTIHGTKMQFNGQFWIFGPNFHNKYDFFIFSIYQAMHAALISFRNNRKSENSKTLKILPLWRKYTIAWPKIRKLWVNLKKCERRKKAIPRQLIIEMDLLTKSCKTYFKAYVNLRLQHSHKKGKIVWKVDWIECY